MSVTAFLWLLVYTAGAILAFVNPAFGLFAYFWEYYGNPPHRWWGYELPSLRWSFMIAGITAFAYVIRQGDLPKLRIKKHPQAVWLVLFVLTAILVTPLAVWEEKHWSFLVMLIKFGVLYFLIVKTIRTKEHFRYLILVNIVGVLWWGWNAFDDPQRVNGRLFGIGGSDSLSDNAAAAHLLVILPFIGAVLLQGKWWEKALCVVAAPFVVNTLVLCNSRASLLGLLAAGTAGVLITKGALRWKLLLGIVLGGLLLYFLMDPEFVQRQSTTVNYKEEGAATERIESWKGALKLIGNHPLGTGGGGFMAMSHVYIPEIVASHDGEMRNVHNTYLQAASEWGVLGAVFFLGFLFTTLRQLHRLRRDLPETPEEHRMQTECVAIEIALVGLIVTGMFINRMYAETFYWLAAFTAVLTNIYANEKNRVADTE